MNQLELKAKKFCRKCHIEKPLYEFYSDGKDSYCAECRKQYQRDHRKLMGDLYKISDHKRKENRNRLSPPRKCKECGEQFFSWRKDQIYCGHSCSTKSLYEMLQQSKTDESEEKRIISFLKHPLCGPFETNIHSNYWQIVSPNGEIFKFNNLSNFVREHVYLFTKKDTEGCDTGNSLAAHQLRRLSPYRKHSIKQWKGWKWLTK